MKPDAGKAGKEEMPQNPLRPRPEKEVLASSAVSLEIAGVLGLLLLIYAALTVWPQLPPRIPSHFGLNGQADAWGGKGVVLVFPIFAAVIYSGFLLLARYPQVSNYPWPVTEANAGRLYASTRSLLRWLRVEMVWFFAWLTWRMGEIGLGRARELGGFLPFTFVAAIFITILWHVVRMYRAR